MQEIMLRHNSRGSMDVMNSVCLLKCEESEAFSREARFENPLHFTTEVFGNESQ